jgi:hypothetical protein
MLLSEKLTLIITLWIIFVMLITGEANLEIFFILIFIGVLIIRELSDVFTSDDLKGRMNLFIYFFLMIFMVIVGRKIMTILSI